MSHPQHLHLPDTQYRKQDRGFLERVADEVRCWLGDDDAQRRRWWDALEETREIATRADTVGDLMTRRVVSVAEDETLDHIAELMVENDCGAIPVVDPDGGLRGIITDRDIVIRAVARNVDLRNARAARLMTEDVVSCYEDDPINLCMRLMAISQVRRLPILDRRERLVGIVSISDLALFAGKNPGAGKRRAVAELICFLSRPARPGAIRRNVP